MLGGEGWLGLGLTFGAGCLFCLVFLWWGAREINLRCVVCAWPAGISIHRAD